MNDAKQEILKRIRAAGEIPSHEVVRDYQTARDVSRAEILDEMVESLVDYTAVVTRVAPSGIEDSTLR